MADEKNTERSTRPSLLARLRDGCDDHAWADFISCYDDLILGYCRLRGLQSSDAEDIRQVVMMSLMRALPKFEYDPGKGRFRSYLGRIVENAIRKHRASAKWLLCTGTAAQSLFEFADTDDSGLGEQWEQQWVRHHYRIAMQRVRATFPPRSVDIFERVLSGAEVADIAEKFETTSQAVHKIKQRIRDRIQELISRQVTQEDRPLG